MKLNFTPNPGGALILSNAHFNFERNFTPGLNRIILFVEWCCLSAFFFFVLFTLKVLP